MSAKKNWKSSQEQNTKAKVVENSFSSFKPKNSTELEEEEMEREREGGEGGDASRS